ncbi:hypothetical protein BDV96DRAFT_489107 [Lophiotrema nucula]|uniref:Uncharacterized protein n=1 Tax=Lophiotrema nucula TaxID=690887 RepID=A0A6A5ZFX6_9PLEO|nr:hypothetical protein BDV96DRAFT_489107 [Lophiotrema nucula]
MGTFTKAQPEDEGNSALDVIFACCICQATVSDIYDGNDESVQGLSDGINPKDRIVSRLWLTSCCHVMCNKHIEGGGPPFHPAGTRPRAPCPICAKEKGEKDPKELYSIRGFKKGEYDSAIPSVWFLAPPIKLDASGKEMEALRFQYVSLLRYGSKSSSDHKQTKILLGQAQSELKTLRQQQADDQAKIQTLQQENEQPRAMQPELQKFKARMPAIEYYLKLIPTLAEQNEKMRERLATVGFSLPLEPIAYDKEPYPFDANGNILAEYIGDNSMSAKRGASSHTAGRSAHTSGNAEEDEASSPQTRPRKRPRQASGQIGQNIHAIPRANGRGESRDLMPPPKKPLSRMRSIKKLIPSMRKRFSHGRSSPAVNINEASSADVQMYDATDGHWETVGEPVPFTSGGTDHEAPYMTGGLPTGHPPRPTLSPDPQIYRPPPQSIPRQHANLPSAPSYIRLMDDLAADTGFNLQLQDPRQTPHRYPQQAPRGEDQTDPQPAQTIDASNENEATVQKRWSLGHAFLHQSPNGVAEPTYQHPDPLRSNPASDSYQFPIARVREPAYEPSMAPVTPAPPRLHQSEARVESVVSPFFKSSNHNSQVYSRAGVAERGDSSIPSDAYRYQRPRMVGVPADYHEPRSLNGLSFFRSPLNQRNERIDYDSMYTRPEPAQRTQQHYPARNLNSRGFIKRPETGRSPWANDSADGSSFGGHRFYSQQAGQSQSAVPFPSFVRPSHSRAAPLPSAMPSSLATSRSPARTSRAQYDNLAHVGVRSSRASYGHVPGNTFVTPSRNLFSGASRRSVRR